MIQLKVRYIAPPTNKMYAGQHWARRAIHANQGHLMTLNAVRLANLTPLTIPVSLTFQHFTSSRIYDLDGYDYTNKILTDGLVKAGVLKDDSQKYVQKRTVLPTKKSLEDYTLITLEEVI